MAQRCLGILAGVGSLLWEAQQAGCTIIGNLETRGPYHTGRHLSWDLNFEAPLERDPRRLVDYAKSWQRPDLILGHPPCGSHSALGASSAPVDRMSDADRLAYFARRNAHRGELPFFIDAVNTLKPRAFALDNLPKILRTSATPEWWKSQLPKYWLTFIIMKNWDYGTPQLRERLWVVGIRRDQVGPFKFVPLTKRPKRAPTTTWEAFGDLPWEPWRQTPSIGHVHVAVNNRLTGDYRTTSHALNVSCAAQLGLGFLSIPPDDAWPYRTQTGRIAVKIGRQRLSWNKRSRTLTGLPSLHHPFTGWPLTPRERARLMDWPDDFQLGNAQTDYDRFALMRLTLFTGKAVPSAFPRYLIPQLFDFLF